MDYTRRDFGKVVLAAVPAVTALSDKALAQAVATKPNSKWAGVQVGMNVPYSWGTGNFITVDEVISRSVQLGLSGLELRAQPIELFLGSPAAIAGAAAAGRRGGGGGGRGAAPDAGRGAATPAANAGGTPAPAAGREGGGGRGAGRAAPTPEQQAAQRAAAEETRTWRLGVSMDRVREVRRKFDEAGILVEIVKWDGINTMADDELDYCFQVSRAVGAKALSAELNLEHSARIGKFADKHQLPFGHHGHAQTAAMFEQAMAQAKYNAVNLDLGHFTSNHGSPIEFIKKYHSRITHVHVKDKKLNGGPNTPLGEGDTPIREVLQLARDNKWTFQATIEFEYTVPEGSDRMKELAKCMAYCRSCLLG
jgi:hypothetical protein